MKKLAIGLVLTITVIFAFTSCDIFIDMFHDPPTADAGEDQLVDFGVEVLLDGSGSFDPDADPITFSWTLNTYPSDSNLRSSDIDGSESQIAKVTPDVRGVYVFELYVADEWQSSTDFVQITVELDPLSVAPETPTGLAVGNATPYSLRASWAATSGAQNYAVYRDTSSGGAFTNEVFYGSSLAYTDYGLTPETTYFYKVKALNGAGESTLSVAASGTTTAVYSTLPAAPTDLAVGDVTDNTIALSWSGAADAESYDVFRSDDGGASYPGYPGTPLTSVTSPSYIDGGLNGGTEYFYKIQAVNPVGSSGDSNIVSTTTNLPAPTGLTISGETADGLTVTWNPVTGATSYTLRISTDNVTFSLESASATSPYNDTALSSNTEYFYTVQAVGSSVSSVETASRSGLTKPAAPTASVANATESTIEVSWADATGAEIYYVYSDNGTGTLNYTVAVYDGPDMSFIDSGLTASTAYKYEVAGWNGSGYGAYSNTATLSTTAAAVAAPATPSGLSVDSAADTTLALSWDLTADASFYELYSDLSAAGAFTTLEYAGPAVSFEVTGLVPETNYYYKVLAGNSFGNSALTGTAVLGTTTQAIPDVPTGLTATPDAVNPDIDLAWTAVAGVNNYNVYWSLDNSNYFYLGSPTTNSYSDNGLAEGTEYFYKVSSQNSGGESGLSNFASATTITSIPVPGNLTASAVTNTTVDLSWDIVGGVDGYSLYRDSFLYGSFSNEVYSGTDRNFTDTGLYPGAIYFYVVKAYAGAAFSSPSTAVKATMLAVIPDTPSGLTVSGPTPSSLYITWNEVLEADDYSLEANGTEVYSGPAKFFEHDGLTSLTAYDYRVKAVNSAGDSAFTSIVSGTTSADLPVAPSSLWVNSQTDDSVSIEWGVVASADTYRIFRSIDGDVFQVVDETAGTTYTDTPLQSGTPIEYKIRSANVDGVSTGFSPVAATSTLGVMPPDSFWINNYNDSSMELSWYTVPGAAFYRVYRSPTGLAGSFVEIASLAGDTYIDSGLNPSTPYWYHVTAVDGGGFESTPSPTDNRTTNGPPGGPPNYPFNLGSGDTTENSITLSWDYMWDASEYRLYFETSDPAPGDATNSVYQGTDTWFTVTGLTENTMYYFRVTAFNSAGESNQSPTYSTSTSLAAVTVPATPAGFAVINAGDTWVEFQWDFQPDVSFELQRSDDDGATYATVYTGPAAFFRDDGLDNTQSYFYQVKATNSVGDSPYTPPLEVGSGTLIIIVE